MLIVSGMLCIVCPTELTAEASSLTYNILCVYQEGFTVRLAELHYVEVFLPLECRLNATIMCS